MAKHPTHSLTLETPGQVAQIWKTYVSEEGIEIESGSLKGRLKTYWIPAARCDPSPLSEARRRAQDKMAEGYTHTDKSQPADPKPQPATQAKASAGKAGINWSDGDWIW
jgi:hypothetical protein